MLQGRGYFDGPPPLTLVMAILVGAGCDSTSDTVTGPSALGPFDLVFSLDASFQALHGGQSIGIAVVRSSDSAVITQANGTVSATQNLSFSLNAGTVMQRGTAYEVHYWIDSNLGGGTPGVCDPKAVDHQWSVEFPSPTNDVMFTASHNPRSPRMSAARSPRDGHEG